MVTWYPALKWDGPSCQQVWITDEDPKDAPNMLRPEKIIRCVKCNLPVLGIEKYDVEQDAKEGMTGFRDGFIRNRVKFWQAEHDKTCKGDQQRQKSPEGAKGGRSDDERTPAGVNEEERRPTEGTEGHPDAAKEGK